MEHPVVAPPRSFLLTVHQPGSAVLEELSSGRRVHVTALEDLGRLIERWLAEAPADGAPRRA